MPIDAQTIVDGLRLAMVAVADKPPSDQKRLILEMRAAGWLDDTQTTLAIVFLGLRAA